MTSLRVSDESNAAYPGGRTSTSHGSILESYKSTKTIQACQGEYMRSDQNVRNWECGSTSLSLRFYDWRPLDIPSIGHALVLFMPFSAHRLLPLILVLHW